MEKDKEGSQVKCEYESLRSQVAFKKHILVKGRDIVISLQAFQRFYTGNDNH